MDSFGAVTIDVHYGCVFRADLQHSVLHATARIADTSVLTLQWKPASKSCFQV